MRTIPARGAVVLLTILLGIVSWATGAVAAPGDITLASTSDTGIHGNDFSLDPHLSGDGTKVVFESLSYNFDPADTDNYPDVYVTDLSTGDIILASGSDASHKAFFSFTPSISADGSTVAFLSDGGTLDPVDNESSYDVWVTDLSTGGVMLASTSDSGIKENGASFGRPSLSADGTKMAFSSIATNLDPATPTPGATST